MAGVQTHFILHHWFFEHQVFVAKQEFSHIQCYIDNTSQHKDRIISIILQFD